METCPLVRIVCDASPMSYAHEPLDVDYASRQSTMYIIMDCGVHLHSNTRYHPVCPVQEDGDAGLSRVQNSLLDFAFIVKLPTLLVPMANLTERELPPIPGKAATLARYN